MDAISAKINFAWWLIKRGFWRQLFQMLLPTPYKNSRADATAWCEDIAISEEDALKKLNVSHSDIMEEHPFFMAYAEEHHQKCPVKMGGPGSMVVLYNIIKALQPQHVVETGVAYGWSTLAILLAQKDQQDSQLISVDMPYPGSNNEAFVGCVVHPELQSNWTLIRKPDVTAIPKVIKSVPKIDFIHYDSDKGYRNRMLTGLRLWKKLSDGGYFMSDDVNDNLAFKHFCERNERDPLIIKVGNKYAALIKK